MSPVLQFGLLFVVGILLVAVAFLLRAQTRKLSAQLAGGAVKDEAFTRKLEEIQGMLALETVDARRLAVLEMYKLFDVALKQLGVPGDTMRDRLGFATETYPSLKEMRIMYDLAHALNADPHKALEPAQARDALRRTRDALNTLHVL